MCFPPQQKRSVKGTWKLWVSTELGGPKKNWVSTEHLLGNTNHDVLNRQSLFNISFELNNQTCHHYVISIQTTGVSLP